MTMEELKNKLLSKKFTHISITKLDDKEETNTVTRRIIKVDSEGCWSFSYLSESLKIYRRLPSNDYKMIENGYIESIPMSNGNKVKIKVLFTTSRRN